MTVLTRSAAQVRDDSVHAACGLASHGLRAGDRVAVLTGEHIPDPRLAQQVQSDVLALVLAALRSGIIPVPMNPLLTAAERAYILRDAQPALVLDTPALLRAIVSSQTCSIELSQHPLGRPMHYTSGTTGRPKGVWTGDLSEAESAELWADEQALWQFDSADLSLVHGPLCHSGPLRFALAVILAGGSVALPGRFNTEIIAKATAQLRPTTAFVVPSHLQRLFALPDLPDSPYRLLAHAGSACPPSVKRQAHAWIGTERVWEFYGSTEGQFTACSGVEWQERPGTVGRARAHRELLIEDGIIWCRAPSFARFRYFGDPDKTARAWRDLPNGRAFSVGDLGRLDEAGYLFIEGRREDLIITGGVNVYPTEVEAVLSACPGVSEVAVFGRADDRWGQAVHAAYIGNVESEIVHQWAREHLAGYKRPKQVHRRTELPRTASGKIKRLEL